MPTVKQSQNVSMKGWNPAPKPVAGGVKPTPPYTQNPQQRSTMMLASMPLMASTSDAFTRQFYGGMKAPTFRTLPVRGGLGQ
jgi:hypothetical protein